MQTTTNTDIARMTAAFDFIAAYHTATSDTDTARLLERLTIQYGVLPVSEDKPSLAHIINIQDQ